MALFTMQWETETIWSQSGERGSSFFFFFLSFWLLNLLLQMMLCGKSCKPLNFIPVYSYSSPKKFSLGQLTIIFSLILIDFFFYQQIYCNCLNFCIRRSLSPLARLSRLKSCPTGQCKKGDSSQWRFSYFFFFTSVGHQHYALFLHCTDSFRIY